jgi:uncharacterized protein YcgL (UPF0745 family)
MLKTNNLTTQENISLAKEIGLVAVTDTPFYSLLVANKRVKNSGAIFHTWRERTLDTTADVTVAEGADATTFVNSGRAQLNNIMEIFMKATSVSGTAQATNGTGTGNLFAQEINDRLTEMKINAEKRLISGVKDDGSVTGIRKMDGLAQFVHADNKVAATGTVTEANVKELARKLWAQGLSGEFYVLVNADIKEQIDAIYKGSYIYLDKKQEFGLIVDTIRTNYGNLHFVLDRHVPADKAYAFDINQISIAYLRAPQFEALAKTGDSIKGQVVGEMTLEVMSKKAVAELTLT